MKNIKTINSFILKAQNNRLTSFFSLFMLSWIVSTYAYICLNGFQKWDLINGLTLSFADMPEGDNGWIVAGKLSWMVALASAIVFTVLKDWLYEKSICWITSSRNEKHIIVISDDFERTFKSLDKEEDLKEYYKILIINHAINAELKEHYRSKKTFFVSEIESVVKTNCEFIIVSNNAEFENIETAKKLDKENKKTRRKDIKIYTRINNYNTMTSSISISKDEKYTNIIFFNIGMRAARQLFQKTPLSTGLNTVTEDDRVHLLIIGFGFYGQAILLEAIKLGHFYNNQKMKITIIHNDDKSVQSFSKYHNYDSIKDIDIEFKNSDLNSTDFYDQVVNGSKCDATYTYIVMSLGDSELTQRILGDLTVKIRQNEKCKIGKDIPFYVRHNSYIGDKNPNENDLIFNRETFSKIDTFDKNYEFKNNKLDEKGKALHETYRDETNPKKVGPWESLEFYEKDKNFAAADHEVIKLKVIEDLIREYSREEIFEAVSLKNKDKEQHHEFKNLTEIQQKMIDMEHRRWNAYHYINGWIHGEKRNNDFKIHTCLVDTKKLEELPQKEQDYYVNDISNWKKAYETHFAKEGV